MGTFIDIVVGVVVWGTLLAISVGLITLAWCLICEHSPFWKFCGWIIAIFLLVVIVREVKLDLINPMIRKAQAEREQAAKVEQQKQELRAQDELAAKAKMDAEQRKLRIEDMLRSFTLKEAPKLWSAYQNLQAEIANQNSKIEELRKALNEFDQDPDTDADFKRVCSMRDDMVGSFKTMRTKIEDAYLAACKYEAMPGQKEYEESWRKLLEGGTQEAEAAVRKYNDMKESK